MSVDGSLVHLISKGASKFTVFSWTVDLDVIRKETTEATDLAKQLKKKNSEQNKLEITKETFE